jgi:hypothetical protein
MPAVILYLLKVLVSLTLVLLFYQLVLRPLTFYNWNRWYLLGYSLISFFIPLLNISPALEQYQLTQNKAVNFIPAFTTNNFTPSATASASVGITLWQCLLLFIAAGSLVLLIRLVLQYFSLRKMMRTAQPVAKGRVNLFHIEEEVIPFSFGNSVFINRNLHTDAELSKIIQHELVHVKQKHSMDLLWSELLCIACWYNPFVWLLKKAIRQNLEFIADNKVIANGINKTTYQYLLLKVTGNNQFSIASQFNFSSLKKRIAMMNKMKSARMHLIKFLFVLPLVAVLLLAFRSQWKPQTDTPNYVNIAGLVVDAATRQPLGDATIFCKEKNITVKTDANGYYLLQLPYENKPLQFSMHISKQGFRPWQQQENWGNFYVEGIKNAYGNTFEFFGLALEDKKENGFSTIEGNASTVEGLNYEETLKKFHSISQESLDFQFRYTDTIIPAKKLNNKGFFIDLMGSNTGDYMVLIKDRNNTQVKYLSLTEWNQNEAWYEKTYGKMLQQKPDIHTGKNAALKDNIREMAVIDDKITVTLNNGNTENYDLLNPTQKQNFIEKYGDIPEPPAPPAPPAAPPSPLNLAAPQAPAAPPDPPLAPLAPLPPYKLPDNVKKMSIINKKVQVILKNGQKENYDLSVPADKEIFEKKYEANKELNPLPKIPSYATASITAADMATARIVEKDALAVNSDAVVASTDAVTVNADAVAASTDAFTVSADAVTIENSDKKQLILLDGKEISLSAYHKPMKGTFSLVTLTKAEAVKKYGAKGKNGAMEITTQK